MAAVSLIVSMVIAVMSDLRCPNGLMDGPLDVVRLVEDGDRDWQRDWQWKDLGLQDLAHEGTLQNLPDDLLLVVVACINLEEQGSQQQRGNDNGKDSHLV